MSEESPNGLLHRYRSRKRRHVIGLMSGTSLDGVDAVLVGIAGTERNLEIRQRAFITVRLPGDIKEAVLQWYRSPSTMLSDLAILNVRVGRMLAKAVKRLCKTAGVSADRVNAVGSHGLTVWHAPTGKYPATLQIGEGSVIACETGIATVSDFRQADMAAGGEGAPLIPSFDAALFRSNRESRALLNIGGIANWTIIPRRSRGEDIFACDTGPGNMVIDALMNKLYGKDYDRNGCVAASGSPSPQIVAELMTHPFLRRRPPKSTGREEFGPAFVEELLKTARVAGLADKDVIATATSFTAESIADNYRRSVKKRGELDAVIVSGGGAHNRTLLSNLASALPHVRIDTLDEHGMSPDAKEAIAFAWLADRTLRGLPGNHPPSTGAKREIVLGKISMP